MKVKERMVRRSNQNEYVKEDEYVEENIPEVRTLDVEKERVKVWWPPTMTGFTTLRLRMATTRLCMQCVPSSHLVPACSTVSYSAKL